MLLRVWMVGVLGLALCHAEDYPSLCREAAALSGRQDYAGAIAKYQAALKLRPGAPEALNNLAVMKYQVGRYADAFQITSKLWRTHPELKAAALIAGMAAVQCNRPQEALAPLQHLLETDPRNRDALLALASAYFASKQLPQAAAVYERELAADRQDTKAWYGAALCYESLAEESSRALAVMPGGAAYTKQLLAEYLQSIGDARLAAEAFGEAAASSSASPEAQRQYEQARQWAAKSREAFEQFVSLAPDSWQTALFLGDVDRQHGNLASAVKHYQAAAEKQPGDPAPLLGLGTAYWELGEFESARSYLDRTLERKPGSAQALFELANINVRQHRDAEAIPLLTRYLLTEPNAAAARADLGRAYLHMKQYENAARELEKAATSDTTGDVHYQLATALKRLGRKAEAETALQKSAELKKEQLQQAERRRAVQ